MKKFHAASFLLLCSLVTLISCGNLITPPSQEVELRFEWDLDDPADTSKSLIKDEGEYYYFYKDLRLQDPPIYLQIKKGKNSVKLPKDGIYIQAIVRKDAAGLTFLGFVGVSDKTLPLIAFDKNPGVFDLGLLEYKDKQFSGNKMYLSTYVDERLALLAEMNAYDEVITNFANPDIDKDGLWDFEEGLVWKFSPHYEYTLSQNAIDYESKTITRQFLADRQVNYVFDFLFSPTPVPQYTSLSKLQLEAAGVSMRIDPTDSGIQPTTLYARSVSDYQSGTQAHYSDPSRPNTVITSGTFTFSFPNSEVSKLTLENVRLLTGDQATEEFYFPIHKLLVNEKKQPTRLEWTWMCAENGTYRTATPEEIRSHVKYAYFSWIPEIPSYVTPWAHGKNYWDNDAIDFTPAENDPSLDPTTQRFRITIRDYVNNLHQIYVSGRFFEYDPRYVDPEDEKILALLGQWECTSIVDWAPRWINMKSDSTFEVIFPGDSTIQTGSYTLEIPADPNNPASIGQGYFMFAGEKTNMLYRFPSPGHMNIITDFIPLTTDMWDDSIALRYEQVN